MNSTRGSNWATALGLTLHGGLPAEEVVSASDDQEQADARYDDVKHLVVVFLPEATHGQVSEDDTCAKHCEIHDFPPIKVQFSVANLPQRLSVSCDSDNIDSIAYMTIVVKSKTKLAFLLFMFQKSND